MATFVACPPEIFMVGVAFIASEKVAVTVILSPLFIVVVGLALCDIVTMGDTVSITPV